MRARAGQDRPVGAWIRHFSHVVTAAALLAGVAACTDTNSEPAPAPGTGVSDSGGALAPSDGGGATDVAPSDAGGDTNTTDSPSPTAASSDGGGQRVTVTADDFPPPDPAHYPGMNTETQQGAIATAEYFWDHAYWSAWSGDTSVLRSMYNESCSSCEELANDSEEMANDYAFLTPSIIVPYASSAVPNDQGFDMVVTMRFTERPTAQHRKGVEDELETVFGMQWSDDHWVIHDFSAEEVPDRDDAEG